MAGHHSQDKRFRGTNITQYGLVETHDPVSGKNELRLVRNLEKEKLEAEERRTGNGKTRAELEKEEYKRRMLEDVIRAREMGHSPNVALDQMRAEHWASWREDERKNLDEAPVCDSSDDGVVDKEAKLRRKEREQEELAVMTMEQMRLEIEKLRIELREAKDAAMTKKLELEFEKDGKPAHMHEMQWVWYVLLWLKLRCPIPFCTS
jgi:hypothetical protein